MTGPPHILVFMTDDHGRWASSVYGDPHARTPTMQRLADAGTVFDHAYTPSPVCSPARASFWTGTTPSVHGVHDYLQEGRNLEPRHRHPGIRDRVHLGGLAQSAGYRTGMIGKWHAGGGGEPVSGFDDWFSSRFGTNARDGVQCFSDNGELARWEGPQSPRVTQRAIDFLRDTHRVSAHRPVFLFVGYTDTHTPHDNAPPLLRDHYRTALAGHDAPERFSASHGRAHFASPPPGPAFLNELADYYASVEFIDQQIAEVLDAWNQLGQLDRTLVVYTSDHGHMNGHHGLTGKGNATRPQNFLDESIRVPSIWCCPGTIREGRRVGRPVDHCDVFTTLLSLVRAQREPVVEEDRHPRPGQSLMPFLRDDDITGWRDWQCCEYGNARMIRNRTHKLIARAPSPDADRGFELYDLQRDPRENHDTYRPGHPAVPALIQQLDRYYHWFSAPATGGLQVVGNPRWHNDHEPWASG